jgi:acyl transferase domain-containing protein
MNFYLSNKISFALGLTGPSMTIDCACSSLTYALDCARRYIMSEACSAAIVAGTALTLNFSSTIEFAK